MTAVLPPALAPVKVAEPTKVPKLVEQFGGKLAFDNSKGDDYVEPPTPGLYL